MELTTAVETPTEIPPVYDKHAELQAFDDTKAGVKGLVDAGISKVPRIFIQPPDIVPPPSCDTQFCIPVIDLEGISKGSFERKEIIERIRVASETWGFFQVINHGIPVRVLEEMLNGVWTFYEQEDEVKKEWYTRDSSRAVIYNSNFDLFSAPAANWRDTLYITMAPNPPRKEDLPEVCRDILNEYTKEVMKLGNLLFELLSEALGLKPSHLKDMDCAEGLAVLCHYYPACPQPELTMGTTKHADDDFLTVLLQDQIGGLQVLYENQWIDVPPVAGALVVNIGDLLQLISNDKFKSNEHRVVANKSNARVSVACFFSTGLAPTSKLYGPIKELLSDDNPPKYKQTTLEDFVSYFNGRGLDGTFWWNFRSE